MSSFTRATVVKEGNQYRVTSPEWPYGLWFYVGHPADQRWIHVPEGFTCDGPSLPRWLKEVLRWIGMLDWVTRCLLKASLIHDEMRKDLQFSLIETDCFFLIAMKADQPNWTGPKWAQNILRELAFMGVRTNRHR